MDDNLIKNKVAESGLINFDISELTPVGERKSINLKDFLYQELVLREKDYRNALNSLDTAPYIGCFVHIENSTDSIIPIWAFLLMASKLEGVAKKTIFGSRTDLELILWHDALLQYDFSPLKDKRILVKGCSDVAIPTNVYVEIMTYLKPIVKSLMFGEACSNVPVFKN